MTNWLLVCRSSTDFRGERGAARSAMGLRPRVLCVGGQHDLQWQVGDVTIRRVEARVAAVPHSSIRSGVTPEVVDEHRPWINPFVADDGQMLLSIHSFVMTDGSMTVVVDTCVGAHGDRPLPQDPHFLEQLEETIEGGLSDAVATLAAEIVANSAGTNRIVKRLISDRFERSCDAALLNERDMPHERPDDMAERMGSGGR